MRTVRLQQHGTNLILANSLGTPVRFAVPHTTTIMVRIQISMTVSPTHQPARVTLHPAGRQPAAITLAESTYFFVMGLCDSSVKISIRRFGEAWLLGLAVRLWASFEHFLEYYFAYDF